MSEPPGGNEKSEDLPHRDQFSGSLIGQCLADALGFPMEGRRSNFCRTYVAEKLGEPTEPIESHPDFEPGQYTDDSQLARELLLSCVEHGKFVPDDYAQRIKDIFSENRIVGRGLATDEAARRLAAGVSWRESGGRPPSAGNGTAMRVAPIGLLYSDAHDARNQIAVLQGWITHQDPRCSAGSIAIAGAVALALHEDRVDPVTFVAQLSEWVRRFDPVMSQALVGLPDILEIPLPKAADKISKVGLPAGHLSGWDQISPFVTTSVLWSLFSFLRSPEDYWESVRTAIWVGGDVDTTAAMTGAISGARVGIEGLPLELAHHVHDRGTWKYQELIDLAHRGHGLRTSGQHAYPDP